MIVKNIVQVNTALEYEKDVYVDKIVNAKQSTMSFLAKVIHPVSWIILHLQYSRSL